MSQQQFKPFAIGDRVISETDGPGTVINANVATMAYPVDVLFDSGHTQDFTHYGHMYSTFKKPNQDIRHMTAEEQKQFPKP